MNIIIIIIIFDIPGVRGYPPGEQGARHEPRGGLADRYSEQFPNHPNP